MSSNLQDRVAALPCWRGAIDIEPLGGGMTNANFVVRDSTDRYVVRVGEDIPVHQLMRFNELSASRAAHAAGISPPVVYSEPGLLVLGYVEGRTLDEPAVRDPQMLERIVALVRRCHDEVPRHLRGPALVFWVFHVLRDYGHTLRDSASRHGEKLQRLADIAATLESQLVPTRIVFGHNDLLAANIIDDGSRLWLIDWDYAGFNSPLFDLGGLATNSELDRDAQMTVLAAYFGADPGSDLVRSFDVMKCASLLRESMWSMVSEIHSELDIDYGPYTAENLRRFEAAWDEFQSNWMAG